MAIGKEYAYMQMELQCTVSLYKNQIWSIIFFFSNCIITTFNTLNGVNQSDMRHFGPSYLLFDWTDLCAACNIELHYQFIDLSLWANQLVWSLYCFSSLVELWFWVLLRVFFFFSSYLCFVWVVLHALGLLCGVVCRISMRIFSRSLANMGKLRAWTYVTI